MPFPFIIGNISCFVDLALGNGEKLCSIFDPDTVGNSLVDGRAGVGEDPPTSVVNSLVAVGAGEDRGWGEKPPTSHNDSLVIGTRRAGVREAHQRVS